MTEPGTPPAGCAKVNQQSNRNVVPYVASNFLECGNASGSYTTSRDRALEQRSDHRNHRCRRGRSAIAGPVADRLQRQVAPRLERLAHHRFGQQLGRVLSSLRLELQRAVVELAMRKLRHYRRTSAGGNGGIGHVQHRLDGRISDPRFSAPCLDSSCSPGAANLQCTFSGLYFGFGSPLFQVNVSATAPRIASSFRDPITAGNITITPSAGTTIGGLSNSLSPSDRQRDTQLQRLEIARIRHHHFHGHDPVRSGRRHASRTPA